MENRGRGRRDCPRENSQPPPVFDPQAFREAIGVVVDIIVQASVVATTTARTSATMGQGGTSNLQRFIAHHPPTFTGGGDPVVVHHWSRQVERILEAMEITSDATQIRITTFRLKGESWIWVGLG